VTTRRSDEAVTEPGQRLDELGILSRVTEKAAEFVNGVIQAVFELDKRIGRPQASAQVFPRDHFSGMFDESPQHFESFGRERDFPTVFVEFARS
jgi:hypothetical protein